MRFLIVLFVLLGGWVVGSEYVWICKVKNLCANTVNSSSRELVVTGSDQETSRTLAQLAPSDVPLGADKELLEVTEPEENEGGIKNIEVKETTASSMPPITHASPLATVIAKPLDDTDQASVKKLRVFGDKLPELSLKGRQGDTVLLSSTGMGFESGISSGMLAADQSLFVKELALYLQDNPDSTLEVVGYFSLTEKHDDSEVAQHSQPPNSESDSINSLGLLRAEFFAAQLFHLGVEEERVKLKAKVLESSSAESLYPISLYLDHVVNKAPDATPQFEGSYDSTMPQLSLKDSDKRSRYKSQRGFGFATNSSQENYEFPGNDVFDPLVLDLRADDSTVVQVIGHYSRNEINDTTLPNLGLSRAMTVSRILENKGLAPNKIVRSFREIEEPVTGFYGIELQLTTLNSEMGTEEMPEDLFESVQIYFTLNADDMLLTDRQRSRISQMIQYLKQWPLYQILIVGHTDSQGQAEDNLALGIARANRVKDYIVAFGVDKARIATDSKGELQPVMSNDTDRGRQLNRRVELLLQKIGR